MLPATEDPVRACYSPAGNLTRNRQPCCDPLSSEISPPCASTTHFVIARPSPAPPGFAPAGLVDAIEPVKDFCSIFSGNSRAVILNLDRHVIAASLNPDRDRSADG